MDLKRPYSPAPPPGLHGNHGDYDPYYHSNKRPNNNTYYGQPILNPYLPPPPNFYQQPSPQQQHPQYAGYYGQPTNLTMATGSCTQQQDYYPLNYSSQQQHPSPPPPNFSSPHSSLSISTNYSDTPTQLLNIELSLVSKLKPILIPPPVSYIYSPLEYAYEPHADYVRKYCKGEKRILFLGMNPGPWGMSQTGVPFGEVNLTRSWLKIEGRIGKPLLEHPSRIVEGFNCPRSEVSGQRFWSYWKDLCKEPEVLFEYSYVHNYCPLAFMKDSGRNVTPPELKARERNLIFQACDEALLKVLQLLKPEVVIGVGKFPQQRVQGVVQASSLQHSIRVESILHPSPVNPTANKGWRDVVHKQLIDLGLMPYFIKRRSI